jgi:hypothetical protein
MENIEQRSPAFALKAELEFCPSFTSDPRAKAAHGRHNSVCETHTLSKVLWDGSRGSPEVGVGALTNTTYVNGLVDPFQAFLQISDAPIS